MEIKFGIWKIFEILEMCAIELRNIKLTYEIFEIYKIGIEIFEI